MSLSGISLSVAQPDTTQNVQATRATSTSAPAADGSGPVHHKGHGRGGHVQQALAQALQSLGLSLPQPGSTGTSSSSTSASTTGSDSDGDQDGSTSATDSVKADLRQFTHALFEAVKGQNASASSGSQATGSGSADPKANFAAGLSALISQVSNGTAPADLQSAFSKLAADLQGISASPSGTIASGSSAPVTAPAANLQALLTQLQQNLGYGSGNSASASTTGNILSTQA